MGKTINDFREREEKNKVVITVNSKLILGHFHLISALPSY